jgi:ribosome assembly protein YihI (activator of Der GTPase)
MAKKKKAPKVSKELDRLETQSDSLRALLQASELTDLSKKKHHKFVRQLDKIDSAIQKITKLGG